MSTTDIPAPPAPGDRILVRWSSDPSSIEPDARETFQAVVLPLPADADALGYEPGEFDFYEAQYDNPQQAVTFSVYDYRRGATWEPVA